MVNLAHGLGEALGMESTTGYIDSSGRACQAVTSAITESVTELMTSVPYYSARKP